MSHMKYWLLAGTVLPIAGAWPAVAQAQDGLNASEDEIIVTARKRAETLADIPVAVSAIGEAAIERNGFDDLRDITLRTPGVQFTEQASLVAGRARQGIRFRGMDTNQFVPSQQIGTAFLDGVYVSTGIQALDLGALDRVEVIRGPQSAIFGRNTFGGAVNYITKDPSFEFGGRVSAELAEYGTYDVAARIEGPILGDDLAARLSVRGFGTNGQYRSVADGGRLGEEQTESINLVLLYEPTDQLSVRMRAFYSEERDGPSDGIFIGSPLSNNGNGPGLTNCDATDPSRAGTGVTDYFCGNIDDIVDAAGFTYDQLANSNTTLPRNVLDLISGPFGVNTFSGVANPVVGGTPFVDYVGQARDQFRLMASIDYTFGAGSGLEGHTWTTKGGYSDVGLNWIRDFDYTAVPGWADRDAFYDRDYTFETRIASPGEGRLTYSAGFSYIEAEHQQRGATGVLAFDYEGVLNGFGVGGPLIFYGQAPVTEGSEAWGLFGTIGYDITDQLTLDLEGRYQEDTVSQVSVGSQFEDTFKNFLPRATLSFEPTESSLLWATYSKGNLPGFFNSTIVNLSPTELAQVTAAVGEVNLFNDEEELDNFEIGWRQSAFDNMLNFSLVAYYMDWTNQKTRVGVAYTDDTGTPRVTSVQVNAGNSELYGLELEGTIQPTLEWSNSFSLNIAEAEYTEFTCSFAQYVPGNVSGRVNCDGQQPPKFPGLSGSFTSRYQDDFKPLPGWDWFSQLSGTYFGKAYNEETNFSWYGEYWRFDARAGLSTDDLRLEIFVENLFDNSDPESAARSADFSTSSFGGFSNNFGIVVTPPEKRTFGVRATYDF